jgi:hypothetical protein
MQAAISPDTIAVINESTETTAAGIQSIDQAVEPAKLDTIKDSMREYGWQGAPLVVAGEQALTGTHRLAAIDALRAEGTEIEIPRIEVADLCELFGIDWQALEDDYGMNDGMDWYDAARHLDEVLPRDVVDYLGLDIH